MDVDKYLAQLLTDRHEAFDKALHYLNVSREDEYNAASRMIDRIDAIIYALWPEPIDVQRIEVPYPVILPEGHEVVSIDDDYISTQKSNGSKPRKDKNK